MSSIDSVRRQLSEKYIVGVSGQPSREWRDGALWALNQVTYTSAEPKPTYTEVERLDTPGNRANGVAAEPAPDAALPLLLDVVDAARAYRDLMADVPRPTGAGKPWAELVATLAALDAAQEAP